MLPGRHLELVEGIKVNLGHDHSHILSVVGGDDMPWRIARARRAHAFFVSLHIVLAEFALRFD
jgi:hypothetical protein